MMRTKQQTPLFNCPDFLERLDKAPVDESFHIRFLETILLPKRPVDVVSIKDGLALIKTKDYLYPKTFYTLSSFLEEGEPLEKKPLPDLEEVLLRLEKMPKHPYLLGGTTVEPTQMFISSPEPFKARHQRLFGIDCSGLLYYVCEGHTPRNTKELMSFGKRVSELKPLDLILFPGHVLIYLGDDRVIESRERDGIVISKWSQRKKQLPKYQFNRFHPQALT